MEKALPLNDDQQQRIKNTLKRIRSGLDKFNGKSNDEPAPMFQPEAFNDK